jgi:hypothetical protein
VKKLSRKHACSGSRPRSPGWTTPVPELPERPTRPQIPNLPRIAARASTWNRFDESPGCAPTENYPQATKGVRRGSRFARGARGSTQCGVPSTPYSEGQGESMKRTASVLMLLAAAAGCVSTQPGAYMTQPGSCQGGHCRAPASVPGVVGPWGQPVPMAAPYNAAPPGGKEAAYRMMNMSLPMGRAAGPTRACPARSLANGTAAGVPGTPAMPGCRRTARRFRRRVRCQRSPGLPMVRPSAGGCRRDRALRRSRVPGMPVQRTGSTSPARPARASRGTHRTPAARVASHPTTSRRGTVQLPPGRDLPPQADRHPTRRVWNCTDPRSCRPTTRSAFLAHSAVPVTFTEDDFAQVARATTS